MPDRLSNVLTRGSTRVGVIVAVVCGALYAAATGRAESAGQIAIASPGSSELTLSRPSGSGDRAAPKIYSSTPFGSTVWWPEHDVTISLCDVSPLASHSVTSPTGTVVTDVAASCGPGESGTAYQVRWTGAGNNPLQEGDNYITANVCNQWSECTSQTGAIKFYPPIDSVTVQVPSIPEQVRPGAWDTLSFVVFSHTQNQSYTYNDVTATCLVGVSQCSLLSSTSLTTTGPTDPKTVQVQYRADSLGPRAVTINLCRGYSICVRRSQTVAVTLPQPVAAAVTVTAIGSPAAKGSGTTFAASFRVKNTGTASTTYQLVAQCDTAVVASGCTLGSSTVTIAPNDSSTVNVPSVVAKSSASLVTGAIRLTATAGAASATGQLALSVGPNGGAGGTPSLTVAVGAANPSYSVARDQCLMFSAGDGAGVECGDLRLVQGMPGVRTLEKVRGPSLIYLSRHAEGLVRVAADVRVLHTNPDSLRAVLRVTGGDSVVRRIPWPATCRNLTCRIVLPVMPPSGALPTGLHHYTLAISTYGGTALTQSDTGRVVVVNRVASPFGRGWWLEGLEQILHVSTTQKLWIGADGSSRLYNRSTQNQSVYVNALPLSRRDTLLLVAGGLWVRNLPNGAFVEFNGIGRHVRTVNAQGHETVFSYDAEGTLSNVVLPGPNVDRATIQLFYTGTGTSRGLDSVQVKGRQSSVRGTLKVTRTGLIVTRLRGPDTTYIEYAVNGTTGRVTSRRSRRGDMTYFTYDSAGAVAQSERSLASTSDSSIVLRFCAQETRSLVACSWDPSAAVSARPLPDVVTRVDGPRGGLIDVMTFYVGRFGGPDTLIDATGGRTRIVRNDSFPTLVARVTDPIGRVQRAWYNARGLPDSTEAPGPNAEAVRTRHYWHPTWSLPDSTRDTLRATQRFFNNTYSARVDSQQVKGHDSTRVRFYYDGYQRLDSVKGPGGVERFQYDVLLGNVSRVQSANSVTWMVRDRFGQDSIVYDDSLYLTTRTYWGAMGRVDSTTSTSKSFSYTLPYGQISGSVGSRSRIIRNSYDLEGNLLQVTRLDTAAGQPSNSSWTEWRYDAAGRVRARIEPFGTDSFWYDPAGLETRKKTGRGHVILQQYDAMGRLTARIIPEVSYARENCLDCTSALTLHAPIFFPYFETRLSGGGRTLQLVLQADVETFSYDAAGRMTAANNREAKVSRGYYTNGLLKADTLRIRTYDPVDSSSAAFSTMVFVQSYEYDLLGRRTRRNSSDGVRQRYTYDAAFGNLTAFYDVRTATNDSVGIWYRYDAAGRRLSDSTQGGIRETRTYDGNGRLATRSVNGGLFADSYQYDTRGKLIARQSTADDPTLGDSVRHWYDGFGAVVASDSYRQYGEINTNSDEYSVDALGNVHSSHLNRGYTTGQSGVGRTYLGERILATGTNPLSLVRNPATQSQPLIQALDSTFYSYDGSGNQLTSDHRRRTYWYSTQHSGRNGAYYYIDYFQIPMEGHEHTRSYYDAANRLRQFERNTLNGTPWHTVQQYRYDALGRRVLLRTVRDSTKCGGTLQDTDVRCLATIDRFVWDGDQIATEYRTRGRYNAAIASLDSLTVAGGFFGQVRYGHVAGIDDPAFVQKGNGGEARFVPLRSGRGGYEAGLWWNGTSMTSYHWPLRSDGVYPGRDPRFAALPVTNWYGSLLDNKADASGMIYMRNRYYDPATGRFTQRDPIGLAGGVNQYGYVGGDPVNHSDPFGLCTTPQVGLQILRCALGLRGIPPVAPSGTGAQEVAGDLSIRVGRVRVTASLGSQSGLSASTEVCLACATPASVGIGGRAVFQQSSAGDVSVEGGAMTVSAGPNGLNSIGVGFGTPDGCAVVCAYIEVTPEGAPATGGPPPAVAPDATAVRPAPRSGRSTRAGR